MAYTEITINGNPVATDLISSRHFQQLKMAFGPEGTASYVADESGHRLPVTGPVSVTSLPPLAAGTNNIGDVDVSTLPALAEGTNNIGHVDIDDYPASDFSTDGMVTRRDMSKLSFGIGAAVDVLRYPVELTAQNGAAVVANSVASKKLVLLGALLMVDTAGDISFEDDAGSPNVLVGPCPVLQATGFVLPPWEHGWGITGVGQALRVRTSASMDVGGVVMVAAVD